MRKKQLVLTAVLFCAMTSIAKAEFPATCTVVDLQPGKTLQVELSYVSNEDSSWNENEVTVYRLDQVTGKTWVEEHPGTSLKRGAYRFVAASEQTEKTTVSICGESTNTQLQLGQIYLEVLGLLKRKSVTPGDLGLPEHSLDLSYDYSAYRVHPGFGESVQLSESYRSYLGGIPVGVLLFSSEGYPEEIVSADDPKLREEWLRPSQLAVWIVLGAGNDPNSIVMSAEEKLRFIEAMQAINQDLSNNSSCNNTVL